MIITGPDNLSVAAGMTSVSLSLACCRIATWMGLLYDIIMSPPQVLAAFDYGPLTGINV